MGESRVRFIEVVATYWYRLASSEEVTEVAIDLLLVGPETPELAMLAGSTRREREDDFSGLVCDALHSLGLEELMLGRLRVSQDPAAVVAAGPLVRRHLSGQIPAREVAAICHRVFGHDSHEVLERVVFADDQYDVCAGDADAMATIDEAVGHECQLIDQQSEQLCRRLAAQLDGVSP